MLTSIKKVRLVVFSIALSLCISNSLAVVKPKKEFYVNDYANIISEENKEYIISENISLEEKTGVQVVVVTVPNLEDRSLEEYSNQLFREFGIGYKEENNGLLLLLALEERQFRVEVGYGLEGILPDAKTGRIQDEYIIPYLKENNWNEGIRSGFDAFVDVINTEYEFIKPPKVISLATVCLDLLALVTTFVVAIVIRVKKYSKRLKKSLIYLVLSTIVLVLLNGIVSYGILIANLCIFLVASFATIYSFIPGGPSYSSHYHSGGRISSGVRYSKHNHGGGGSAGGGGSSRRF